MDKLRQDSRHHNLRLLADSEINARMFGNWSMGLVKTPDTERNRVEREIFSLKTSADADANGDFSIPHSGTFAMMQRLYETDKVLQRARGH